MANYSINFAAKTIKVTKSFMDRANIYGTNEYNIMFDMVAKDFRIVETDKNDVAPARRLDYKLMHRYMVAFDNENVDTFEYMKKNDNKTGSLAMARKWFFENHKEVKGIRVSDLEQMILLKEKELDIVIDEDNKPAATSEGKSESTANIVDMPQAADESAFDIAG